MNRSDDRSKLFRRDAATHRSRYILDPVPTNEVDPIDQAASASSRPGAVRRRLRWARRGGTRRHREREAHYYEGANPAPYPHAIKTSQLPKRFPGSVSATCTKATRIAALAAWTRNHCAPTVCIQLPMLPTRTAIQKARNTVKRRGAQVLTGCTTSATCVHPTRHLPAGIVPAGDLAEFGWSPGGTSWWPASIHELAVATFSRTLENHFHPRPGCTPLRAELSFRSAM